MLTCFISIFKTDILITIQAESALYESRNMKLRLIKIQLDATVCRYLFTAKSLYMFRVSQHPSSGVLKTLTAASGTGHNIGTATSLQRGLIGTGLCESRYYDLCRRLRLQLLVLLMMGAVTPETCRVTLQ